MLAEIGGVYLVRVAIRDGKGLLVGLLGALGLAIYGGVFIVGSMVRGVAFDCFRPDRYDLAGAPSVSLTS